MSLRELIRPELRDLAPYPAASQERDFVRLHANESPQDLDDMTLNRYPESQPARLVERLAEFYGVSPGNVLATRGSDDAIDLLVRCFCRAGRDAIVVCPPTFAMYAMAARLQDAAVIESPLRPEENFALDPAALVARCDHRVRLVFLCSPNNPTGNLIPSDQVIGLCAALRNRAVVVVDEAYIEFAQTPGMTGLVEELGNLAVLRTLSKACALAGARCGALVATRELIDLVRPALPPYPLPTPTVMAALGALAPASLDGLRSRVAAARKQREWLRRQLDALPVVRRAWPSQGNFLLAEVERRDAVIDACRARGVLIRDLGNQPLLGRHVRITVGTPAQNRLLVDILGELR